MRDERRADKALLELPILGSFDKALSRPLPSSRQAPLTERCREPAHGTEPPARIVVSTRRGETLMAKGQMRPQKEVKKPKKDKTEKGAKSAPASFEKGVSASGDRGKKKD